MPYVTRNSDGIIQGIYDSPPESNSQWMEMQSPEVMEFLQRAEIVDKAKQELSSTDYEMVRVIDDLIDLLIAKQIFIFTELPQVVQKKLGTRKKLRKDMEVLGNLIDDDSNIL